MAEPYKKMEYSVLSHLQNYEGERFQFELYVPEIECHTCYVAPL